MRNTEDCVRLYNWIADFKDLDISLSDAKKQEYIENLIYLDLHNSQLTTLPKEIGNLVNLKSIYLGQNNRASHYKFLIKLIMKVLVAKHREIQL